MTSERIEFRCPHCRRAYSLQLDAEKLARLDRIAVCGRCKKPFSLAKRVREGQSDPPTEEPPITERELRAALIAKRALQREERERRGARERGRAAERARVRARESKPEVKNTPQPIPVAGGKRRWDSGPSFRTPEPPPTLSVRDRDAPRQQRTPTPIIARDLGGSTPPAAEQTDVFAAARARRSATPVVAPPPFVDRRASDRPIGSASGQPGPHEPEDARAPRPRFDPQRTVPRAAASAGPHAPFDDRPTPEPPSNDASLEAFTRAPSTKPPPGEPTGEAESSPPSKPPLKRRITSPGLGRFDDDSDAPPSTPAPISAPSPRRLPPGPAVVRPIAPPAPEAADDPVFEVGVAHLDDYDEETLDDETLDDDEDFEELDGGDRPTLLLPGEPPPRLSTPFDGKGDGDGEFPTIPRNASARVVMSRNDWIKAADPGLTSLVRREADEVVALHALLDLPRPTRID